ncbi:MAG: ABC transporter substrate-binding protein, partial [Comamonas sp.]
LQSQTISQMVDAALALPEDTKLMVLGPLARDKKGEFTELFAQLQAQGYVRFRIDGKIHEVESLPQLQKNEKHSIDVVIDRLKVRPDAMQRLAESFEAALRAGGGEAGGRVVALEMDTGVEHWFSAKFACPICSYSLPELEPRLFSFNSPQGACPTCDGLGQSETFDPERVVAFPTLSLASGAVKGWDRRNAYYFTMLESVAAHYGADIEAPFEELPEQVRQAVLWGSGEEAIAFAYFTDSGKNKAQPLIKHHPFEGIIPNITRRYRETDSSVVRDDLARMRSTRCCPDCEGTRLRREARFHNGKPVLAKDVKYSFETLIGQYTSPAYKTLLIDVAGADVIDERTVRFRFHVPNRELPLTVGGLPIFSPDWARGEDGKVKPFDQVVMEIPIGSGPYRVGPVRFGKDITYVLDANYWARDLGARKGTANFERVSVKIYKDNTARLEALKAGEFDLMRVYSAGDWARRISGKRFSTGELVKGEFEHKLPSGFQSYVLNTRRPLLQDARVREALDLAMDYEWMNRQMFYGSYYRVRGMFG